MPDRRHAVYEFSMEDQVDEDAPHPAGTAVVEHDGGSVWLGAVGYGDFHAQADEGRMVRLERAAGRLRLVVWADRGRETPTHVIDLEGAKLPRRR